MRKKRTIPRSRGAYWILGALFLLLAVNWGIVFNAHSVFVQPVQEALGTDRSAMLLAMVYRGLSAVGVSLAAGGLINRWGALGVLRVACVGLVLSFYGMSRVQTLGGYYFFTSLQVAFTILSGFLPCSVLVNDWFPGKNATAMSIAFMGSGIGGMVFNALCGRLLILKGWRETLMVLCWILALVLLPLAFFILRENPQTRVEYAVGPQVDAPGIWLREAIRTPQFWLLMSSFLVLAVTMTAPINNMTPNFQDLGWEMKTASFITSIAMLGMSLGKLLTGWLFDRFGLRATALFSNLTMMICLMGMIQGAHALGIAFTILGFTFSAGYVSMGVPVISDGLYGRKDFSRISGSFQAAYNVGTMVGPLMIRPLYVVFGGYAMAWTLFLVLLSANFLIYWRTLPGLMAKGDEDLAPSPEP